MRLLLSAWLILIAFISLGPSEMKVAFKTFGAWHDVIHFAAFLLTAVLSLWTASGASRRFRTLLLLVAFCFALELLETCQYHNFFEWLDLYFDLLGLCFGWIAVIRYGLFL